MGAANSTALELLKANCTAAHHSTTAQNISLILARKCGPLDPEIFKCYGLPYGVLGCLSTTLTLIGWYSLYTGHDPAFCWCELGVDSCCCCSEKVDASWCTTYKYTAWAIGVATTVGIPIYTFSTCQHAFILTYNSVIKFYLSAVAAYVSLGGIRAHSFDVLLKHPWRQIVDMEMEPSN
ncbi:hypothetical protein RQP46_003977 [Phenoliferia psychrophenolica]